MLFRMNPDGSGQMEYYGSNSYWPNAMYWPRPIPGHPTEVVCVVSGHHGVSRVGELVMLDPARGRHEADGVVQRIPGYGKKVEPIILDQLVTNSWPKFAAPCPLAEPETNLGAGKYFLVSVQRTTIRHLGPLPGRHVRQHHADPHRRLHDADSRPAAAHAAGHPVAPRSARRRTASIYLADIYQGDGLRGYPRGSIKALRDRLARIPLSPATATPTPRRTKAAGTSRRSSAPCPSTRTARPCSACRPTRRSSSSRWTPRARPSRSCGAGTRPCRAKRPRASAATSGRTAVRRRKYTAAAARRPAEITPWNGPTRGFSFDREVQPVLDRRCVGCHNGQPVQDGDRRSPRRDLRAKQLRPTTQDHYSPAYMVLQKYVRRPGYESDIHLHAPAEFEADTSPLVQMLKKGHHNVQLSRDEWERLYTWIDFNVPYPANWRESHRPPQRRAGRAPREVQEAVRRASTITTRSRCRCRRWRRFEPPARRPRPPGRAAQLRPAGP